VLLGVELFQDSEIDGDAADVAVVSYLLQLVDIGLGQLVFDGAAHNDVFVVRRREVVARCNFLHLVRPTFDRFS
jgi:hypothetical protein